ncbi:hypothetical protein AAFN86_25060 [Roseomonas sp. CAU 1739]|uniref:hypothetical protein n=1 Tax=Roseomonas sp. CAU 1739 TaxID=3140364 RepID=UPI00325B210C
MLEPEGDGGSERDGAEQGVCAAIMVPCKAAPVLEPAEHDRDAVALAVEKGVVRDGLLDTARRWNAGCDAARGQGVAKVGDVSATIHDCFLRPGWEPGLHASGAAMITGLTFDEQEHNAPALSVAGGVGKDRAGLPDGMAERAFHPGFPSGRANSSTGA